MYRTEIQKHTKYIYQDNAPLEQKFRQSKEKLLLLSIILME